MTAVIGGELSKPEGSNKPMMIVSLYQHFNVRLGEWFASLILFSLGSLLIAAPSMFSASASYFAMMAAIASATAWGVYFGTIGTTRIVALFINGRKPITPYIRMVFSFIACFAWFELTLSLFLSGVPGLGWAVFPWLLALDMYNVFRSSADARDVFDRQRARRSDGTKSVS